MSDTYINNKQAEFEFDDFADNFTALFNQQVLKDRGSESRLQSRFRASGISSHPRAAVLDLLNLPSDKYTFVGSISSKSIKLMERGTQIHNFIQAKLLNMGVIKEGNLESGLRIQDDDLLFSGHPDGVGSFKGEDVLLEFKTINSYGFKWIKEPKLEHYQQGQAYMHFLEKCFGLKIRRCMFIYIDRADDDMAMKIFKIEKDEQTVHMILNKLKRMKEFLDAGKIPPMQPGETDMGMYSQYNTPFFLDPTKNSIEDFPGYRISANVATRNVFDK